MKAVNSRPSRRPAIALRFAGAVLVAGAALVARGVVSAEEPPANTPKVAPVATTTAPAEAPRQAAPGEPAVAVTAAVPAPVGSGGWIAYIDPETGRLIEAPPADSTNVLRVDAAFAAGLSTSDDGLVEEVLPDGTVKVNLQGRFQSASFATVQPDGSIAIRHAGSAAPPAAADGTTATPPFPRANPEPDHDH